jgi:hypothetical protein
MTIFPSSPSPRAEQAAVRGDSAVRQAVSCGEKISNAECLARYLYEHLLPMEKRHHGIDTQRKRT